jgi:hypothetical protein
MQAQWIFDSSHAAPAVVWHDFDISSAADASTNEHIESVGYCSASVLHQTVQLKRGRSTGGTHRCCAAASTPEYLTA